MYGINFGDWNSHSGSIFIKERIYFNGYRWTPFIIMSIRYKNWKDFWNNLLHGLNLKKIEDE